ncbi:hypothetical protein B296_00022125, partial [Ensete ventricosum]
MGDGSSSQLITAGISASEGRSKGYWENLRFERDSSHTDIENGSFTLSANPWFQHFRSPLVMKQRDLNSSDGIGDIKFIRPAAKMASERLDEEATNSKHICHQDSIGSST